jgi:hypothetical protein
LEGGENVCPELFPNTVLPSTTNALATLCLYEFSRYREMKPPRPGMNLRTQKWKPFGLFLAPGGGFASCPQGRPQPGAFSTGRQGNVTQLFLTYQIRTDTATFDNLTKESFCGIMTTQSEALSSLAASSKLHYIDIKKAVTERSRRKETAREMKP